MSDLPKETISLTSEDYGRMSMVSTLLIASIILWVSVACFVLAIVAFGGGVR